LEIEWVAEEIEWATEAIEWADEKSQFCVAERLATLPINRDVSFSVKHTKIREKQ